MIQVKAWEKDGKLAVFVGNFWQMGECFFRLKVPGLQANKKYFVSLASQRADFCAENKQGFTGAELAKGVLLHVGALRWNAYIIRESAEKGFAKVTPSRVVKAMNDKKQTIKTAYANEMKHLQKMNARKADDKKPDYSELKGLENGKVKCTIKNGVYSFETPVQKIQVELAKGGRINSWKVYGREIVMNTGKFSAAMECGLEPTDFLSSNPVKFVSLKKHGKDALVLTLSRRLSHSDGKSMVGVQLYKRYTFHPEGVDLSVKVNNSTPNSMKLNFRWHNMFIVPEIKFQGYNNSNWFKRTRDLRVYRLRGKHHLKQYRALEKAITGSVAQMRDPAENWIFTITPNPSVLFSAYIMWDGSGAASTLEPMFDEILLNEGQSADYEIKFRIKKK